MMEEYERSRIGTFALIIALTLTAMLLAGCATGGGLGHLFGSATGAAKEGATGSDPIRLALTPFALVGTLSILAGIALLFVTKLSRGWIPLLLGVGLCILAWVVASWATVILWILIPLAVLIGIYHLWYVPRGRRLWKANGPGWFSGLVTPWRSAPGSGPDA